MTEESGVYNNESVRDGRRFYACMYTINLKFQVIIGRGLLNNWKVPSHHWEGLVKQRNRHNEMFSLRWP